MSRYIEAEETKRMLREFCIDGDEDAEYWFDFMGIEDCIDNTVETADVRENVKGEWIRRDSRYVGWISFDCSVCGETLELDRETSNDFKYCPFCGAEMGGDNNGQRNDS